jgi:hypothetical protein
MLVVGACGMVPATVLGADERVENRTPLAKADVEVSAVALIQVALPDTDTNFDVDFEQARKYRKKVLDQVASDRLLVAGIHLHYPGFYHVARQGDGYFLRAEAWQHAL